ncbi:MAG: VanZ family protein [Planctomycetota bacterium]
MSTFFERVARLPMAWRLAGFFFAFSLVSGASFLTFRGGGKSFSLGYLFNLGHVPLYGLLAFQVLLLQGPHAPRRAFNWSLVLLLILVTGLADEWHQGFMEGRTSSLADIGSDLLGALIALNLARWAATPGASRREGVHLLLLAAAAMLFWGFVPVFAPVALPRFLP